MDPCPFARIVISNVAFNFPKQSHLSSLSFYSKFKLKGFPSQVSDVPFFTAQNDAVEGKTHASFSLNKTEFDKLAEKPEKLKIEIYRREINGCAFVKSGKFQGRVVLQLDLKNILENHASNRASLIKNGWVPIGGGPMSLHLNVKAEPDPRFVFQFDGEPECSPQVFQINGSVKQPVFTCKFGFRNSGEINAISRCSNSTSESGSLSSCLGSLKSGDTSEVLKERKGWSITIHDLSGSPVAVASMVTPFVPSMAADRVSKSNPGAWLILRPGYGTWRPWGRLEAWREGTRLCYRFELVPEGGLDAIQLANSSISTKTGGKFSVDITNGPTPMASPNSSFDFSSGWGSGSEIGSASGSGSWAQALYRGFVMSSTVEGGGRCSRPVVEVGVQHVTCTEDAAAFVAVAAAMDLSMDACRLFSQKLRKELRQPDLG